MEVASIPMVSSSSWRLFNDDYILLRVFQHRPDCFAEKNAEFGSVRFHETTLFFLLTSMHTKSVFIYFTPCGDLQVSRLNGTHDIRSIRYLDIRVLLELANGKPLL